VRLTAVGLREQRNIDAAQRKKINSALGDSDILLVVSRPEPQGTSQWLRDGALVQKISRKFLSQLRQLSTDFPFPNSFTGTLSGKFVIK